MTKNIKLFIYLIFYHREIVKLDHFIILSLSFANTVLLCSRCKIHRFVAAPFEPMLWIRIRSYRGLFGQVGTGIIVPDPDLTLLTRKNLLFVKFFFKKFQFVFKFYVHENLLNA
jgi:hypothetical protein